MIPQSFIQELLARVDIVDVVGRHVQLRKAGANLLGLCPFHAEKSPSFTVSPTKQFYHCFGCGAHGSAIGFLMEHLGLGYVEAIRELAQQAGMQVPEQHGGDQGPDRRAPDLLEVLAQADRFYRQRLRDSPRAIAYLKGRGLSGETAARFSIGYAPDQWRGLEAAVADYDAEALVTSGLVIEGESEGGRRKRYDRFRDRIMFPIRNQRGQIVGFGGRVLDKGEPKYLNSPETPVFSKGRELYGLFEGRDAIRTSDCVIVVEGYMDVVMLAQHGVRNAVATLGTSTTPDHVRKLLRAADRVVFAFDGDAAGRKAAWRALEASLPQASDTRRIDFLFLPPEHDPDSYVREHGAQGFEALLDGAMPLSELLLRELRERVDLATPEGRAKLLADARPLLQALQAEALRLQLVHRIAALAELAPDEVERYLRAGQPGPARGAPDGGRPESRRAPAEAPGPGYDPADAGGQGRWRDGRGGDGRRGGRFPGRVPRVPVAAPDLETRVRLLAALHPALAAEAGADPEWLGAGLAGWLAAIAALPPGSAFSGVCEALREASPREVAALERLAEADAAASQLSIAEARAEIQGALAQLRARAIRQRIDELVARGISTPEDRLAYQELMAMRKGA